MSSPAGGMPYRFLQLKDEELIRLLPDTAHEKYDDRYHGLSDEEKKKCRDKRETFIREPFKSVLDALWLRHESNMRKILRGMVFAPGSTLCPPQEPSKEDFVAGVLARAYRAFLARTFSGEYHNFPGHIWTIVMSAALDERKHLKGRFHQKDVQKPIPVPLEDLPEPQQQPLSVIALEVRRIMDEYAKESEENKISTWALRKKWIEEQTWEELADELLSPKFDTRNVTARAVSIRRFVEKDEQKLKPRLAPLIE